MGCGFGKLQRKTRIPFCLLGIFLIGTHYPNTFLEPIEEFIKGELTQLIDSFHGNDVKLCDVGARASP